MRKAAGLTASSTPIGRGTRSDSRRVTAGMPQGCRAIGSPMPRGVYSGRPQDNILFSVRYTLVRGSKCQ